MRQDFSGDGFLNGHVSSAQFVAPQSSAANGKGYLHMPAGMLGESALMNKHGYLMPSDMQLGFKMQNSFKS